MLDEHITRDDYARLVRHLTAEGVRVDADCPPVKLSGGLANFNYRISIDGHAAVLRVAPSGDIPKGAHDMAREHFVLSGLAPVFPLAPQSLHLTEDRSILGAPFQIIEFKEGRIFTGDKFPSEPDLAANLHSILAGVMGQLHGVSAQDCGLGDLGRPEDFLKRTGAGWSRRGRDVAEDRVLIALVDQISGWLERALSDVPAQPSTLLHCDIKLDNLVFAQNELKPVALLDWDMATRGHPLFDLGTLLSYWLEPDCPSCLRDLGQMPTWQVGYPSQNEMIVAYSEATGRSVQGIEIVHVLCLFKLGIVFLQLHQRWQNGALGDSQYARFKQLGVDILEYTETKIGLI